MCWATVARPINFLKKGKPSRVVGWVHNSVWPYAATLPERTPPGLYSSLILSEKLYPHLLEIDRAACERMDAMLPRMMEAAGVTEELKARDPMRWVGLMNMLRAQIDELIFCELIYG